MTTTMPDDLGASGSRFWREMTSAFQLAEHELLILREAARTVDLLDALEAVVRDDGAVVESPQGRKANPAAVEARQQRVTLARLVAALRIPDAEPDAARLPRRATRGVYSMQSPA